VGGGYPLVVKRIAAPDKERLAIVNSEIETMVSAKERENVAFSSIETTGPQAQSIYLRLYFRNDWESTRILSSTWILAWESWKVVDTKS